MLVGQVVFSQGFGTRYECNALIFSGKFSYKGKVINDPGEDISIVDGDVFHIDGRQWLFYEKAIVMLNKPQNYECSTKPKCYPSVNSLLPTPLRKRGLQPVGRLDVDTTGLLILTNDGQLNHKLTHPKKKIPKVYEVSLKHQADESFINKLLSGVKLKDEKEILKVDECRLIDEKKVLLTISQGKYHQVKRMVAAASNRVEGLKRVQVGKLLLPDDLEIGQWKWVNSATEIL